MNILGINAFFHDPSAAILRDGKLVAFVEEERLLRVKHAMAVFPERSIDYCLKASGLRFEDLDAIVCQHQLNVILENDHKIEPYKTAMALDPAIKEQHFNIFTTAAETFLAYAKNKNIRKAVFAPHHQTHLATAFFGSGWNEALVLSIDGRGEKQSAVIAKGHKGKIEVLNEIQLPSSLGLLYASATKFLGYTPFDGEGTVMGLAAYGEDVFSEFFSSLVESRDHGFFIKPEACFNELIDPLCKGIPSPLVSRFGPPRPFNPDPRNGVDENIAASLQACLERTVTDWVRYYVRETGLKTLCIAGGVGLNSKMNGHLLTSLGLENLYVFPVAGDAGCAIGAAMWYAKAAFDETIEPVTAIYTGPEYSEDEIRASLDRFPVTATEPSDIAEETAQLIAQHQIVGWFQGRMEGGPRALGARSILSNPSSIKDKDNVNIKVKFREFWRPFAPSILFEKRRKYTGSEIHSPFMTITFQVPEPAQKEIPGAMHVDGTIRVQTLKHQDNPSFYRAIERFECLTGLPVVTNTSFNRKGEPIVNTPAEAIEMFLATEMDALAIGPFLIKK